MSGKSGQRETGNKPNDTRRHDSETPGAFGQESIDNVKSGVELNRKLVGNPPHPDEHAADEKASEA
jgi:hypothetical protein